MARTIQLKLRRLTEPLLKQQPRQKGLYRLSRIPGGNDGTLTNRIWHHVRERCILSSRSQPGELPLVHYWSSVTAKKALFEGFATQFWSIGTTSAYSRSCKAAGEAFQGVRHSPLVWRRITLHSRRRKQTAAPLKGLPILVERTRYSVVPGIRDGQGGSLMVQAVD